MLRKTIYALVLLLWPVSALAQAATLIADSIQITSGGDVVIASGNVEVLHEGQRLLAERIIYTQSTDQIDIQGSLTIIEANGAILTGESAQLSRDFTQGIVSGARFILDGQMQIAAAEMNRIDGRYNQLYKAVASSCRVCETDPTPLWRIRAKRVVHDQEEKQPDLLFSYMYRLDVEEHRIKEALKSSLGSPDELLARLIWERQKQRLATRKAYKENQKSD